MLLEGYKFKKVKKAKAAPHEVVEDPERLSDVPEQDVEDEVTDVSALHARVPLEQDTSP